MGAGGVVGHRAGGGPVHLCHAPGTSAFTQSASILLCVCALMDYYLPVPVRYSTRILYKNIIKVSTVQEKDQLRELFDNWKENNQERRFLHI